MGALQAAAAEQTDRATSDRVGKMGSIGVKRGRKRIAVFKRSVLLLSKSVLCRRLLWWEMASKVLWVYGKKEAPHNKDWSIENCDIA